MSKLRIETELGYRIYCNEVDGLTHEEAIAVLKQQRLNILLYQAFVDKMLYAALILAAVVVTLVMFKVIGFSGFTNSGQCSVMVKND